MHLVCLSFCLVCFVLNSLPLIHIKYCIDGEIYNAGADKSQIPPWTSAFLARASGFNVHNMIRGKLKARSDKSFEIYSSAPTVAYNVVKFAHHVHVRIIYTLLSSHAQFDGGRSNVDH